MDTKLTELVFLLDRSGSMNGLEKDTIGGFNGMIEKQKNGEGKINVTTVLFDDKIEIIHCIKCGRIYFESYTDLPVPQWGYCPDCRKKMRENAWKNVKKAGKYVLSKMRKK